MTGVLDRVEWGGPALGLLSRCRRLDDGLPAIMHIRHSERPRINSTGEMNANLNERGKEAAQDFGTRLPGGRRYRLYHSYYNRTKETAEEIHQGIREGGGESEIGGTMDLQTILDPERYDHIVGRDSLKGDTTDSAVNYFLSWTSGRYHPSHILPSLELARKGAGIALRNLETADAGSMDIYVSHDTWVAALMFHWFGLPPPSDWVSFIDGFILQIDDDKMNVYTKDVEIEVHRPHWWGERGPSD